jgi:phage terminase small subunit
MKRKKKRRDKKYIPNERDPNWRNKNGDNRGKNLTGKTGTTWTKENRKNLSVVQTQSSINTRTEIDEKVFTNPDEILADPNHPGRHAIEIAKQELFCHEFCIDFNRKRAADRAGYKAGLMQAKKLLEKEYILDRVEFLMAIRIKKTEVTRERVIQELARIAFFDYRKAFRPTRKRINGKTIRGEVIRLVTDMSAEEAAVISSVKTRELFDKETGDHVGYAKEIKYHSKEKALEMLGRTLAMFTDKVSVKDEHAAQRQQMQKRDRIENLKQLSPKELQALGGILSRLGDPSQAGFGDGASGLQRGGAGTCGVKTKTLH